MRKTIAAAAVFLGLAFSGATASEATQVTPPPDTVKIVPAAVTVVYNARKHGPRCRFRARGCRYYYGGWWYARPWWRIGPVVIAPPVPGYWVYNPHRHGPRCRYRGPHCGYYHNGWWYGRPFWSFGFTIH